MTWEEIGMTNVLDIGKCLQIMKRQGILKKTEKKF